MRVWVSFKASTSSIKFLLFSRLAWWSEALSCVSLKNENISKSIHRVVSPYLWRNSLWFFQWLTLNITGCFFTGCIINLEITPTWEKGVKKSYLMKGQEIDFQPGKESEQSFFDTSTGNLAHETPKKWKQKEKQKENVNAENMCCVCSIAWESLEDLENDSFWIACTGKTCKMQEYCSL